MRWMRCFAWGYADDEEAFTNILIFTDCSGTMTDSWSRRSLPTKLLHLT